MRRALVQGDRDERSGEDEGERGLPEAEAESRDRGGAISSVSTGVSRSSGSSRWRFSRFAMSRVGCTSRAGPGHRWMIAPNQFSTTSVFPIWLPNISTTRRHGLLGLRQSIGSRRYGVRSVRHGPGSLLPLRDSIRCASAHSLTVIGFGGLSPSRNASR